MYHILYMYVSIFQCTRHINVPVNCGEIWQKITIYACDPYATYYHTLHSRLRYMYLDFLNEKTELFCKL